MVCACVDGDWVICCFVFVDTVAVLDEIGKTIKIDVEILILRDYCLDSVCLFRVLSCIYL